MTTTREARWRALPWRERYNWRRIAVLALIVTIAVALFWARLAFGSPINPDDIRVIDGDTIRVHVKIKEGDKERLQAFEGTVIARKNTGLGETVTVRKVSFGQGVERIFPIHAPVVDHIDVIRTGRVRRAKLYYLRELKGKAARLRERD